MAGFSRGQNVSLHRGLHQLWASTNSNKTLYRLITITSVLFHRNDYECWVINIRLRVF